LCTGPLVRDGIESCDCFVAGCLLAGGDVDFRAAGLKETVEMLEIYSGEIIDITLERYIP
jgi:hypothetical protein